MILSKCYGVIQEKLSSEKAQAATALAVVVHPGGVGGGWPGDAGHNVHRDLLPHATPSQASHNHGRLVQCKKCLQTIITEGLLFSKLVHLLILQRNKFSAARNFLESASVLSYIKTYM